MEINLETKTKQEEIIKAYLEENASDVLADKINAGEKTLSGCMGYIRGKAKELAVNGCACIEDKVVFGWAVHYFEEDEIKENAPTTEHIVKPVIAEGGTPTFKKVEPKPKKADKAQLSLFDLF